MRWIELPDGELAARAARERRRWLAALRRLLAAVRALNDLTCHACGGPAADHYFGTVRQLGDAIPCRHCPGGVCGGDPR